MFLLSKNALYIENIYRNASKFEPMSSA